MALYRCICGTETRFLNDWLDIPCAANVDKSEVPKLFAAPLQNVHSNQRYSTTEQIRGLCSADIQSLQGPFVFDTEVLDDSGLTWIDAICVQWIRNDLVIVSLFVTDKEVQIVSDSVPPCTSLNPADTNFPTQLLALLSSDIPELRSSARIDKLRSHKIVKQFESCQ